MFGLETLANSGQRMQYFLFQKNIVIIKTLHKISYGYHIYFQKENDTFSKRELLFPVYLFILF